MIPSAAQSHAKILSNAGASASAGIQAIHGSLPLPQAPSWMGYWTFVTATILGLFVLYTAKQGTLPVWISFLGWGSGVANISQNSAAGTPAASIASTVGNFLLNGPGSGLFAGAGGAKTSVDPVAGSTAAAIAGSPTPLAGSSLGMGN
jgi:hypothetical protein